MKKLVSCVFVFALFFSAVSMSFAKCQAYLACGYSAVTTGQNLYLYYNGRQVNVYQCVTTSNDNTIQHWEVINNCKKDPGMME